MLVELAFIISYTQGELKERTIKLKFVEEDL